MNDWNDAEQRVEKARELFEQRKWLEALEELRAAVNINPYNCTWLFNIGLTLDEMERFEEAVDAYRQSIDLDGENIETLNRMGIDLSRIGRHSEALEAFARIEAIDPAFEPCYCNRIVTYTDLGDHDKAEEMFYLARMYKDDCPHCFYNIGCSLFTRELYDKAIYCWEKTLDLDDCYSQVHLRMAEAFRSRGSLEKARQHYLNELRRNPGDTDTLLDLGNLLLEMDHIEEAGEKFHRAIELAPEKPDGYYFYGRWLLETGRPEEAAFLLNKALQLDPTYPGAHLQLGRIHHLRGNREAARRHLRNEHLLMPEEPQILMDLANMFMDNDDAPVAVACLKRLTQGHPSDARVWQNLAVANFLCGFYTDGITASHQALRHDPNHLMAMFNLAITYQQLGQLDVAQIWVDRGLQLSSNDAGFQRLHVRLRLLQLHQRLLKIAAGILPSCLMFLLHPRRQSARD